MVIQGEGLTMRRPILPLLALVLGAALVLYPSC